MANAHIFKNLVHVSFYDTTCCPKNQIHPSVCPGSHPWESWIINNMGIIIINNTKVFSLKQAEFFQLKTFISRVGVTSTY